MSQSRRNFLKYFFFIFIINLFFLLALEGLTRIFVPPPHKYFYEFKDDQGRVWVKFLREPSVPKFLKKKPENSFRVFAFGESTTWGFPYGPRTSFPKMLELGLRRATPEKELSVFNFGLVGMNSLEVKYCLFEALRYAPDLVIIYSGQNEFFQISLVQNWRHPKLDRFLDFFRFHSRLYQSLLIAGRIVPWIPLLIGTHQEWLEKLNIDFEQLPNEEKRPLSAKFYQDQILARYRYHLEQILTKLKQKQVPVLLCTLTANLRDWPPQWYPFPSQLSGSELELLKKNLYQAELELADGNLGSAEKLLDQVKPFAQNYAMYHFVLARLLEKQSYYDLAQEHFLQATERDSFRDRAPPEMNQILRELAQKHQIILIDVEKLFRENAQTIPGFDLLVDHVHPNLLGQKLIAEKLYQTLIENQLVKIKTPAPEFPSLEEFKLAFQVDDDFLRDIHFRLALFYLLQRRLPDRDQETIRLLREVIQEKPIGKKDELIQVSPELARTAGQVLDQAGFKLVLNLTRFSEQILARVFLASVLLSHSQEPEALQTLQQIFTITTPEELQKTLERYLFPNIIMQGNYLLFHLNLEPTQPLFRGIILVRKKPEQTRTKISLPLDQYNWVFQYLPEKNELINITDSSLKIFQAQQKLCKSGVKSALNVRSYFLANPKNFYAQDSTLSLKGKELRMEMFGTDPWLVFPIRLNPVETQSLKLKLAITPGDPKLTQAEFSLYWSSSRVPVFSEAQKISLPVEIQRGFQTLEINLGQNLNWLNSQEVFFLRLDPANFPGKVRIREFQINFCALPSAPSSFSE